VNLVSVRTLAGPNIFSYGPCCSWNQTWRISPASNRVRPPFNDRLTDVLPGLHEQRTADSRASNHPLDECVS